MESRAVLVPRSRGEAARRELVELGALRTDLAIFEEAGFLLIPVSDTGRIPVTVGAETRRDFSVRRGAGPSSYLDLLDLAQAEKSLLPRSFDVIGDVVLVRLPRAVASRRLEIGDALLRFVPNARIVGWDHGVHGVERLRTLERIAGEGSWRTRHRENHVELEVDLERAYFSPRLAREHALVASAIRSGEVVYDLCCGIGPFTVQIARHTAATRIVAVDLNPFAIELLQQTLVRYGLVERVDLRIVRIEEFVADAGPADRAILNLPREGIKYVGPVSDLVAPGGQFHYYEVVPRSELAERAGMVISRFSDPGAWASLDQHVVHPYSPSSDLVGFRFARTGRGRN